MTEDSIPTLLQEYAACQSIHANSAFENRCSVQSANKAADRMRAIAKLIASSPSAVSSFGLLLDSPNSDLARWASHHLLELMTPEAALAAKALKLIEQASKGDSADAMGEALWLDEWHVKHR